MGTISERLFERSKLPKYAIIYAGAYTEYRSNKFLEIFDSAEPIKGNWIPYSYAKSGKNEYFVVYGVYGGALTLEGLKILQEGGVEIAIFIGLAFSKHHPIGHQLIANKIYDRAGIVMIDKDGGDLVLPHKDRIILQKQVYENMKIPYNLHTITSVPCVLHGISQVYDFVKSKEVDGVECELSTFHHFANKMNFENYSFLVVSDNPTHSLFDHSQTIDEARILGRNKAGKAAIELINSIQNQH